MSRTRSWSAGELAKIGSTKRGVPMIPSAILPPRAGMLTIKDLLILSRIATVLNKSTAKNRAKTIHSFFEKEERARFISCFLGNLPVILNWRIRLYKFSIKEMFDAKYF